jgi:hypothetical protein
MIDNPETPEFASWDTEAIQDQEFNVNAAGRTRPIFRLRSLS